MPKNHNVYLGTYQIYITRRGRSDERVSLGEMDEAGTSFLDFAAEFFEDHQLYNAGSETDVMRFQREKIYESEDAIFGRIWCGETGVGERVVHHETGDDQHEKMADHAGVIPYYFQLQAPAQDDVAVLVLQRLGIRGAYSFFSGPFADAFRRRFEDRVFHIEPALTPELAEAIANAPVKRVTWSSYTPKSDLAASMVKDRNANNLTFRFMISAKKGTYIDLKEDVSALFADIGRVGREPASVPPEWKALGDRASITLSVNGRERTVTLGVGRDVVPYEEVPTTREDYDSRGWPLFDFVHREAENVVAQLRRRWRRLSGE